MAPHPSVIWYLNYSSRAVDGDGHVRFLLDQADEPFLKLQLADVAGCAAVDECGAVFGLNACQIADELFVTFIDGF